MDTYLLFLLVVGSVVAGLVGGLIYRDASNRNLAHSRTWALSAGGLSGIAMIVAARFPHHVSFTLRKMVSENEQITIAPFEVPLTGLVLGLILALLIVATYRLSTSTRSTTRAGRS
ncbi:hypothetical protein [Saliphagus sp. LR7]|uniref:hypothetical protein n=1 Tax=Saliphagus sp. LR7 TaxID=2282654 RepID=UPI001300AFF7|nr:hypothetical protein [Saliphagus sp. LR7]